MPSTHTVDRTHAKPTFSPRRLYESEGRQTLANLSIINDITQGINVYGPKMFARKKEISTKNRFIDEKVNEKGKR